jgi:hypothetical protein
MTSKTTHDRWILPTDVEEARLRSLHQLQVLDSPPEDRFARITRMARAVFGVPMASISLIDRDRLWRKQSDGLGFDPNMPREESVCQATIARSYGEPDELALILEDATTVPEFAELPAIARVGGIRFYAGYPLYGPGGHPVGVFCIFDTRPRGLNGGQLEAFRQMAAWAQRELEQSEDLERAAAVQRQLLPRPLGDLPGYTVCALCIPAFAVGGDFYDHYLVSGGAIFTVADLMGKGLGAAILTASVRSALRAASRGVDKVHNGADVSIAVNSVAEQLADDFTSTETFVTLFHARLDTATGIVQYVDAGHGLAAIVRRDGEVELLVGDGLPLGVLPDVVWTSQQVALEPGDMLVIASDGSLELPREIDSEGAELKFLAAHPDPEELCAAVTRLTARTTLLDDVTVVAVRRNP